MEMLKKKLKKKPKILMLHHRNVHHIKSTSQRTKHLLRAKVLWSALLLQCIKRIMAGVDLDGFIGILYGEIRT